MIHEHLYNQFQVQALKNVLTGDWDHLVKICKAKENPDKSAWITLEAESVSNLFNLHMKIGAESDRLIKEEITRQYRESLEQIKQRNEQRSHELES